MVMRIESGRPVAHVAAEMGISRPTAHKWWNRWRSDGLDGLVDRSSRPRRCPHETPPEVVSAIAELRRTLKQGPARIGMRLGVPASTVHRVLCRLGLNRLQWIDRPTGEVIRRIHTDRPGELVHIDVKKLGRIPDGGGWRSQGRAAARPGRDRRSLGMSYVHSVTAVLTDNAKNYCGHDFTRALAGIEHRRIRPYTPKTNGKVERFNRTLLEEWAYVRSYRSDLERADALDEWLHLYNHHRNHTAIGGPPISRVNDLPSHYI
jgi:transposase InsO family protein